MKIPAASRFAPLLSIVAAAAILENMLNEEEKKALREIEAGIHRKYKKALWGRFLKSIKDYELLREGDRVAVCISGGKDSTLMALLFRELLKHSIFPFEVRYIVMDPGYAPENRALIENNLRLLDIPAEFTDSAIFDAVYHMDGSPCYVCARMRRGHLYACAKELGCSKIALGHHYDDVIETILMGMLFGAQMQSMMPKLKSLNFPGMELIRPMYLIHEDDIEAWRDFYGLSFLQCACRFTENQKEESGDETVSRRALCRKLIRELEKIDPDVGKHIFRSAENVMLDTLIAYKQNGVRHHFLDDYDET